MWGILYTGRHGDWGHEGRGDLENSVKEDVVCREIRGQERYRAPVPGEHGDLGCGHLWLRTRGTRDMEGMETWDVTGSGTP